MKSDRFESALTHARWILLKRPKNLTDKQELKLAELLQYNLKSIFSPTLTTGAGAFSVIAAASLTKRTRLSPWEIIEGLGDTTIRLLPVVGACAAAGLVIGGLSMTGLGMKIANVIITLSAGSGILTLLIAALVTIILGLGIPTPSAYILAAVLVAPALIELGFPMFESHMFLLYFAILSALTPPIAVAALAAAAIAEEDPISIALSAVRLAAVGFLFPLCSCGTQLF